MSIDFEELRRRYADPDAFLTRTRDAMTLHGITQTKRARRTGYKRQQINRWLTRNKKRRVRPGIEHMLYLDEALEELIGSRP